MVCNVSYTYLPFPRHIREILTVTLSPSLCLNPTVQTTVAFDASMQCITMNSTHVTVLSKYGYNVCLDCVM